MITTIVDVKRLLQERLDEAQQQARALEQALHALAGTDAAPAHRMAKAKARANSVGAVNAPQMLPRRGRNRYTRGTIVNRALQVLTGIGDAPFTVKDFKRRMFPIRSGSPSSVLFGLQQRGIVSKEGPSTYRLTPDASALIASYTSDTHTR